VKKKARRKQKEEEWQQWDQKDTEEKAWLEEELKKKHKAKEKLRKKEEQKEWEQKELKSAARKHTDEQQQKQMLGKCFPFGWVRIWAVICSCQSELFRSKTFWLESSKCSLIR